ncbi:WD40 repeat [Dillenia turbinata]|uniref:Beta'-coat protein n=1 Tax=Dillenia turbinata TaxID=194707 RepID=A0AAN8UKC1_9MAGN
MTTRSHARKVLTCKNKRKPHAADHEQSGQNAMSLRDHFLPSDHLYEVHQRLRSSDLKCWEFKTIQLTISSGSQASAIYPIAFLSSNRNFSKTHTASPNMNEFTQRSERVKSVDFHPTEPWILTSLYSGNVRIWNYKLQTIEKSIELTQSPVRSAKFIARKQWLVAGADDTFIRVYSYSTGEKIKEFEAHKDYIRCLAVHPTLPYVLSASDDHLVKLWDWEKDWECIQTFEGHSHYVMQVAFNPKDTSIFASASLDGTSKIWNLGSPNPISTLGGHSKGLNCVEYFSGSNKSYLITGSDDQTAKVWDCETKTSVQTLEGHIHNVTAACVHPELPIIITGSEDGTVGIWQATTYKLEKKLNHGLGRIWAIGCLKDSLQVAFGCDEGATIVSIKSSCNEYAPNVGVEKEKKNE